MATGNIENWAGTIADIGPLYPFVGTEFILWIIGMALWIGWHIWQSRIENAQYDEERRRFGDKETLRKIIAHEDPENP
jgi:hypothetical protein